MKIVKFVWIGKIIAFASILGLLLAFEAKAQQSDSGKFPYSERQVLQAPSVRIQPNTKPTLGEVENLVADAYVHCFPIMENYKGVYFYGVSEASPFFTPMNTVKHETRLYTAADTAIVRANNDTFYSTGVLDLRAEPVIFKVPESEGRYYVFQLVSMTTDNFGYIGTRNTGSQAGTYAVTSPDFSGSLPDGVTQIKSPSEFVAVGGRTGVNAEDSSDIEAALALQSKFEIGIMSKFYPEFKPNTVEPINFPFNGKNPYTLTFAADQIPPAKFFWSLTMYDNQTGLMSHNELNRYSIGDRTKGLRYHSDGSLTIYMGHKMPIEGPSNWLPAPNGPFDILLRLYGPKDEVMTKSWIPQPVVRLTD